MQRILVLNPGATSTKVAIFEDDAQLRATTIRHPDDELAGFAGSPLLAQLPYRIDAIESWLTEAGFTAVVGRGGLLRPLESGTYEVGAEMLEELRLAARGEHASNLGAFLAAHFAEKWHVRAFIVDPVSVDELTAEARLSGLAGLDRECLSHALNTKAVAKRFATELGRDYGELKLIVVHMGSGISVSAHCDGRMIDVNNSREEGPFAVDRTGGLPALSLVQRAIGEEWTADEAERKLFREGGVFSYLGTRDVASIVKQAKANPAAAEVLGAMLYQVRKEVGAMAAVLRGEVDAVVLTGGMVHSDYIRTTLARALEWIAPVKFYPGEDEMQALADGALRVLRNTEPARQFSSSLASLSHPG